MIVSFLISCVSLFAAGTDAGFSVPIGGIITVPLESGITAAYVKGKRVAIARNNKNKGSGMVALVGVSLYEKPGQLQLKLEKSGVSAGNIDITVVPREFGIDYLTITKKTFTDPTKEDLKRAGVERKEIQSVYRTWNDSVPTLPLVLPAKGRISSTFGKRRFINRVERNPHRGLDIAAPVGTVLKAPSEATVAYVHDMFYTGNTVILSHGGSLYTLYSHLDTVAVKVGDAVTTGQKLGTIGSTGRVTGPHVHISVYLNHTSVDPEMLFTK